MFTNLVQRGLHEVDRINARYLYRILKCHEDSFTCANFGVHGQEILAEIAYGSACNFKVFTTSENGCKGALARSIGTHDRMNFTSLHLEVDSIQDLFVVYFGLKIFYS